MKPHVLMTREAFNLASMPRLPLFKMHPMVERIGNHQADMATVTMQPTADERMVIEHSMGPLLTKNDPPPYTVLNETGKGSFVIIADHASQKVPEKLGSIVDDPAEMSRHIAWDIGTEDISRHMSQRMDAPAIIAGFSRLVIDLNRGFGHPQQVPTVSDGTVIKGNQNLTVNDVDTRVKSLYNTYHSRIDEMLDKATADGRRPVIIFVHSFTPEMDGFKRPWEIGILWNKNRSLAKNFIRELADENPGFNIGDNQPYSLRNPLKGNSIETHAESRNLPHIVIEFRQDLVDTPEKARAMADMAIKCLERAVEREHKISLKSALGASFGKEASASPLKSKQRGRFNKKEKHLPRHKALSTLNW